MEEVGVKLIIEGEAAFFATLDKVNKAINDLGGTSSAGLTSFEKALDAARKAAANTDTALDQTAKAFGNTGTAAQTASGLYQDAAGKWRNSSGQFASDAEKAAAGVEKIPDAARRIPDGLKDAESGFSAFEEVVTGALRRVGEMLVEVGVQGAQAIAGFAKDSIDAASGFESGLNEFAAAAGGALDAAGLDVEDFSKLFLQMGKELPVSTAEVQQAAIALVKGGLDPAIIAAGALESSLNFAAGAGMGLEAAAELSVKMLGTFTSITDDAATKTAFMAEAQDLLVKAAGASTLNVDALGDAMLAAGGQAKAVGLDYQEFVTTMGLISPAFGSAAEAGTSFKNFLTRLAPSTAPAKDAMADLNLMTTSTGKIMEFLRSHGIEPLGTDLDTLGNQFTEFAATQGWTSKEITKTWSAFGQSKFFDEMTGEFIGVEAAAELLQNSLSGLSDVQRVQALQTIFGNDAMGAAAALADGGAEAYRAFAAQMEKANGVAAQAEAVQKGFGFAVESAKGSLETLQIVLGMELLPVLASFINTYLTPAINLATEFSQAIFGDIDAFLALPGPLQTAANLISGFFSYLNLGLLDNFALGIVETFGGDALLPILGFIDGVREGFGIFGQVLASLPLPSFGSMMEGIGGILSVVLPPITDFVNTLSGIGQEMLEANVPIGTFVSILLGANPIFALAFSLFKTFSDVLPPISDIIPVLVSGFSDVSTFANIFVEALKGNMLAFVALPEAAQVAVDGILGFIDIGKGVVSFLINNWQSAVAVAGGVMTAVLAPGIAAGAVAFAGVLVAAAPVIAILGAVGVAVALLQGAWEQNLGGIQQHTAAAMAAIQAVIVTVMGFVTDFWARNGEDIVAFAQSAWQQAQEIIGGIVSIIAQIVTFVFGNIQQFLTAHGAEIKQILDGAWQVIQGVIQGNLDLIQGIVNTVLALMKGDFSGAWEEIQKTVVNFAANLGTVFNGLWAIIQPGIEAAWNNFRESVNPLGRDVIDGILNGIQQNASKLFNGLRDLASNALKAAQDALNIGSPSRLFAEEVGEPISLGIAQGILNETRAVTGALAKLSDEAVEGMADLAERAAQAMGDALSGRIGVIRGQLGANDYLESLYGKQEDYNKRIQDITDANAEIDAQVADMIANGGDFEKINALNAKKTANSKSLDGLFQQVDAIAEVSNRAQAAIYEAQAQANEIAKTDTVAANDYLALRKNQIAEIAKYEQKITDASSEGAKQRAQSNLAAVKQAQELELQQLRDSTAARARELAAQGDMEKTGNAVVDGIISGIQARSAELAAALGTAMASALDAARTSLGIHSPSLVFAQQVGMPIAEGIGLGIEQAMSNPMAAINSLTSSLVRPAAPAVRGGAGGSTSVSQNWNYSPTYQGSPPNPSSDFAAMRVLATAR